MKLENCFLDGTVTTKVADFGLMKTTNNFLKTRCGTLNYMGPELLGPKGSQYEGSAVDVFACGVMLFMLVTAKQPFHQAGDQWYERFMKDPKKAMLQRKIEMSEHLLNLIWNMLAENPSARPTLEMIVHHPWLKQETTSKEKLLAYFDQV